jgi:hypothetical protein
LPQLAAKLKFVVPLPVAAQFRTTASTGHDTTSSPTAAMAIAARALNRNLVGSCLNLYFSCSLGDLCDCNAGDRQICSNFVEK